MSAQEDLTDAAEERAEHERADTSERVEEVAADGGRGETGDAETSQAEKGRVDRKSDRFL